MARPWAAIEAKDIGIGQPFEAKDIAIGKALVRHWAGIGQTFAWIGKALGSQLG